jgi:Lambda phage tail tube protein, TTP
MSDAISAHGTIIARQPFASPGVFTDIGELGDMTPPALSRNSFDVTTHNDDIDAYVQGVLRRSEVTFPVNFLFDNPTHDHLTGLYYSLITHAKDGWQIEFPDTFEMIFSGGVSNIAHKAPVDGAQTADINIRPTGLMWIGGTLVGTL